ncbi:MAG: hypothetical protein ACXAC2_15695 [Candidatus Kariarchaeaceae archaeon]|jgi:hypothetical protein
MAENKIPTIIIAVAGILLLVSMTIEVAGPTDDFVDICKLGPETDCEEGSKLNEVVSIDTTTGETEDDDMPYYLVIGGLIFAVVAVLLLELPALSDFSKFGNFASLVTGILGSWASWIAFSHLSDQNDFGNDNFGFDIAQFEIGGYMIIIGAVLGLAAGIYGLVTASSD